MARIEAVWGIDIGNCSLKALRCRLGEQPNQVMAEAFDYIEYPKILTQPGAEPAELIHDALKQFLSRNSVRGARVAISVSGQNGLARFIRLPPIETKKIPDIVQYEARQQIPFDLNDVIWDYQRMGGGMEEEGFVLEAEVGLFAMKRDQVFRALEPFDRAGIAVDFVQLTPLALYNFVHFDQLRDLPPPEEYDSDSPPPSTVILSLGTDSSDLVITNGFRVWQRSLPIGGSHFTKALTKELKLTFAKAEHLKRNAATAEDPKAVFQAMRPVFNDLLTEIQRSVAYYMSIDRAAKIEKVLALGNAMKLPGLRRYLAQSLGYDVQRFEGFQGLTGSEVVGAAAFQENQLGFGVCYGLTLQGLRRGPIHTNLLPKEIVKDRLIRAKKPWAVAAAAVLMLGFTISLASHAMALKTTDEQKFGPAVREAEGVTKQAADYESQYKGEETQWKATDQIGVNVVENIEGRLRWMELLKAVSAALPFDPKGKEPQEIADRNELHITSLDCVQVDKDGVKRWLQAMYDQGWVELTPEEITAAGITPTTPGAGGAGAAGAPGGAMPGMGAPGGMPMGSAPGGMAGAGAGPAAGPSSPAAGGAPATGGDAAGPTGNPGGIWLVQVTGYHYHNRAEAGLDQGGVFVRNRLLKKLREGQVWMPNGDANPEWVAMKDLSIKYPTLVNPGRVYETFIPPDADAVAMAAGTMPGMPGASPMSSPMPGPTGPGPRPAKMPGMPGGMGSSMPGMSTPGGYGATGTSPDQLPEGAIPVRKFDFTVQFIWEPVAASQRKQKRLQAAQAAPAGQADAAAGAPGAPATPGAVPPGAVPPGAVPGGAAVPAAPAGSAAPGPAAPAPAGALPPAAPAVPGPAARGPGQP